MPLTNGRYTAPTWVNGQAPAIDATELQAMTDTISGNQQRIATITLAAGAWAGSNPYTQTVTISGETITANTKVDLLPSTAVANQMASGGISELFVTNSNGVLTAVALGALPSEAIAISVVLQETAAANPNGLALYSGAKVEIVTYVGTGTFGTGNPTSITFSKPPKLVIISKRLDFSTTTYSNMPIEHFQDELAFFAEGATSVRIEYSNSAGNLFSATNNLNWSGNSVSWNSIDSAQGQLNESGKTYYALAIG